MKIKILNEYENTERGRVHVDFLIDGKKKSWNMPKGLWNFVYKLILENKHENKDS